MDQNLEFRWEILKLLYRDEGKLSKSAEGVFVCIFGWLRWSQVLTEDLSLLLDYDTNTLCQTATQAK